MKKLKFAILGIVLIAGQAMAETTIPWTKEGCESVKGTWVTANSPADAGCDAAHCNGMNFCRGPVSMNFWSAAIWCKSIGRKLVSFSHLCPGTITEVQEKSGACANATGIGQGQVVTDLVVGTNAMFTVGLNNGFVTRSGRNDVGGRGGWGTIPLCE